MNNSCGSNATINSVTVPFANYYTGGTTYPTYTASGTYCSSDSFSSPATRLACPSAITQCTSAGSTNCTVQTFTDTKTGNNNCRTSSGQTASTYSSSCTVKGTQAGGGYGAAITPSFNGCSLPADFTACSVGGNNVPLGLYTATVNSTNSVPNKTFPLSVYVVNPSELNYTCGFYSRYNSNSQTYTQYNILTVKFKDFGGIYYCAYSNDNAYSDANPLACASGAGNGTSTDTITINSIANGIHNLNVLGWKSVGDRRNGRGDKHRH
jgi:hypothetical protein